MKIYHFDDNGSFFGEGVADESPLENGVFHIPRNATETAPPVFDAATEKAVFNNGAWVVELLPVQPVQTQAELDAQANELVKSGLMQIDLQSIRAIREYIASKPDAPQILKDKEAEAVTSRAKMK